MDYLDRPIKLLEREVTELNMTEIRITISLPFNKQTVTTLKLVDERKLDLLRDLIMPESIEMILESRNSIHGHAMILQWESRNREARRLVDIIGKEIAQDVCYFLAKELTKQKRG